MTALAFYLYGALVFGVTLALADPEAVRSTHPLRYLVAMLLWPIAWVYASWILLKGR